MPQADLDDLFKKQLSDFQAAPSSGLWEKINDELPPPTPFYQRRSLQALTLVCLLSFGLGLGYFINNYSIAIVSKSQTLAEANTSDKPSFLEKARTGFGQFTAQLKNQDRTTNSSTSTSKSKIAVANTRSSKELKTSSKKPSATLTSHSQLNSVSQAASTYNNSQTGNDNIKQSSTTDHLTVAATPVATIDDSMSSDAVTSLALLQALGTTMSSSMALPENGFPTYDTMSKTRKGFHVGGFAGYNNTWIINKTLGNKDIESIEYNIDFGENYGIAFGYTINEKWDLQAEWVINSKYKQNYSYFKEGRKYDTEVTLNYFQLPVLLKYSVPLKKNALSYVLGARYARLKSANLDLETPSVRVVDFLNTREVGIIAGLEYQWHMDRRYYLTMGMRSSVGRVFNEWSDINDSSKPFNLSMGIRAGFHYNFVK